MMCRAAGDAKSIGGRHCCSRIQEGNAGSKAPAWRRMRRWGKRISEKKHPACCGEGEEEKQLLEQALVDVLEDPATEEDAREDGWNKDEINRQRAGRDDTESPAEWELENIQEQKEPGPES